MIYIYYIYLYIYIYIYIYICLSGNNNTIKDFKYAIQVNFEVTGISESVLAFNNVFNINSIQNKV